MRALFVFGTLVALLWLAIIGINSMIGENEVARNWCVISLVIAFTGLLFVDTTK